MWRCNTPEYEGSIKNQPMTRSFLCASILYQLREMEKLGIIREL